MVANLSIPSCAAVLKVRGVGCLGLKFKGMTLTPIPSQPAASNQHFSLHSNDCKMASNDVKPASLQSSAAVQRVDSRVYEANLAPAFCVGTGMSNHLSFCDHNELTRRPVPNGGYVASVFLNVARAHLAARGQPHPISAHWSYLGRTHSGRALLVVTEAKIGRGTSVLHIALHQQGVLDKGPWISPDCPAAVVAYITSGNLDTEVGVTLPTKWSLEHAPPSVDLKKLPKGTDPNWKRSEISILKKVPMLHNLEWYVRRDGHVRPTTNDYWLRLGNGESLTQASFGFLSDAGPPLIVEQFRPTDKTAPIPAGGFAYNKGFWYPTLTMTLEVKRKIPDDGMKWIRSRVTAKEVRNGRYDAEVLMFSEGGELLAISNHVAMAVDIERNYSGRDIKAKV